MNEPHHARAGTTFRNVLCLAALGATVALSGGIANADHVGAHTTPCNEASNVGGGEPLGNSPGPTGPPNSDHLGWDVGTGQCNGSFFTSTMSVGGFDLELGLRGEQRRTGQVADNGGGDYEVATGPDTTIPVATDRAWWNFQGSIAYEGDIDDLDTLTLTITQAVGSAAPVPALATGLDLKAVVLDARNNQANPTDDFSDLYQFSQNPVFGYFDLGVANGDGNCVVDGDCSAGTCEGGMCIGEEGAWEFTLTATRGGDTNTVSVCIHTPNADCSVLVPTLSEWGIIAMSVLMLGAVLYFRRRRALPAAC